MNIAYASNLFEDDMDGLLFVEGKDDETVEKELRYRSESCHSLSLEFPRVPTHLLTQYDPHTTRRNRREMEEGKNKKPKVFKRIL